MIRKVLVTLLAVTLSLGALSCAGGGDSKQGAGMAQGGPAEYKLLTVQTGDTELVKRYTASIRGQQDVDIYPQVSGALTRVLVSEGQQVRRGQTLFVVDQVPYQAALAQATASVQSVEAALATARLNHQAKERLYAERIISEVELSLSRNSLSTAQAAVAQAKAAQLSARNNLSYTTVVSPADGVVGTLPYRQGTLVSPSLPSPLTTVSDSREMYVYFSLSEKQLLALSREYGSLDAAVAAMGAARLELSDGSEYNHPGKVESVSGVVDASTGAASLRAKFPNPDGILRSGSTGNVLLGSVQKGVIVIPQGAAVRIQDKVLVYKVVDGKAVSTMVTVEDGASPSEYIVRSGLSAGDVIIAEGAGLVREGTEVSTPKSKS